MAKIVKDTRETIDIDTELDNIKNENKKRKTTKEEKANTKVKQEKTNKKVKKEKTNKNDKKSKKKHFKFLREVKAEMAKVKWPSKKEMLKYSVATIVFIIFFALFFYAIDMIIALLKEVS